MVTFDPANIGRAGGTFAAKFSGANLSDKTYYDVRFRRPGGSTEEVVLNWQQGTTMKHTLPGSVDAGSWAITGVRAHEEVNDHTAPFGPVTATFNVLSK
jgi:hypothetical protein